MSKRFFKILQEVCLVKIKKPSRLTKWLDIGFDSLAFVELTVRLEQEFGVHFKDEEIDVLGYGLVGDLMEVLEKKCEEYISVVCEGEKYFHDALHEFLIWGTTKQAYCFTVIFTMKTKLTACLMRILSACTKKN